MKRNLITLITAAVLIVIFVLLLFTFQVRQSEVAVVTTFGRITGAPREPGLHLRWPWPIQQVYKFDERIQNFQDKFSENLTADSINLITQRLCRLADFGSGGIFSTVSRTAPWPPPKASSKAC